MKESVTISVPSTSSTTTGAPTASQASGGNNVLPSTAAQEHVTSSTGTLSSQPVSKAKPVDPTTAAQLQEIEQQIQNISAKLKSLRTERERLESEGTEEQHKKAMSILEQEQTLERQHKEALFQQKQILNKQTNVAAVDPKQRSGEPTALQPQSSHTCYKLALRLRYKTVHVSIAI